MEEVNGRQQSGTQVGSWQRGAAAVASGAKASVPSVAECLFCLFCDSNLPFHSWILLFMLPKEDSHKGAQGTLRELRKFDGAELEESL